MREDAFRARVGYSSVMTTSSRFSVATHILTLLAHGEGEPLTSEFIAGSVGTNPVVIRRLLARLREARLVASQVGPGGGWQLVRSPRAITLRDVFVAVESPTLFAPPSSEPNPRCPVGRTIQAALASRYESAQVALENELARTSIADLVSDVGELAG